jgi:hypothetical protein
MYWIWKIYITKQFREIKYNEISRNQNHFRRYFVFREIKKSYFATTLLQVRDLLIWKHGSFFGRTPSIACFIDWNTVL